MVDNDSSDNSLNLLQDEFPSLKFIKSESNKGFAGGMNIGIRYSLTDGADYVLLLNNDTTVRSNFITEMIQAAEKNFKIGVVSPKVAYMNNPDLIYCAGGEFSKILCGGISKYQGKDFNTFALNNREISFAEGCCILIKSQVFEKVGLLDEKYFMYFEEVDFSLKVLPHYKILFVSSSIIYHKSGAGQRWNSYSPLYYYYYTRNRFILFSRFHKIFKIYVLFFSTINFFHKLFVLNFYYLSSNKVQKSNLKQSIKSLYKGFLDGLKSFY